VGGVRHTVWRLARRYAFDAIVLGVAVLGVIDVAHVDEVEPETPDGPLWLLVLGVLAMTLPFLARRRFSFGAPASVVIAGAVFSFLEGELIPYSFATFLGALAACFFFGMVRDRRHAIAGLALVYAASLTIHRNDPTGGGGDLFFVLVIFSLLWIAGFALQSKLVAAEAAEERAVRLEREREERARVAVAEERARIARELHDVVGHAVSVMTVQASAVRRLLTPEQEREREALLTVEQTGREALAEMRRMVGVLRRPEEAPARAPQPSLDQLDQLVAKAREAGLPVDVRVEGTPKQLPAGVDLTVYRLVQEGLTNAIKHARATRAEVLVRYGEHDVELEVSDDGVGQADGDGTGHGLVGMRERVAVYGGELDTGPRPGGGFALRARLPVTGS
jgi:signal transduction histidine kinase